jgi:hypothetical protein
MVRRILLFTETLYFPVCGFQIKYADDDSTAFWAVGIQQTPIAARAESCGKEVTMTVPLENTAKGEVSIT